MPLKILEMWKLKHKSIMHIDVKFEELYPEH